MQIATRTHTTKHTPGPWARIIDERGSITVQGNTGPYGYTVAGFGSVDAVNGETQLANAALIAAAPDLFHALRVLVWRTEGYLVDSDMLDDAALLAECDNVLAKAEGLHV